MPPKKDKRTLEDDIEEIKNSLSFQAEELSKLTRQQDTLTDLMKEIKALKMTVQERDQKIEELEKRLN